MTDIIQIVTTAGSQQEANQIAAALIEQRLAACVQISGPITSVYRWQGKVENGQEWLCAIKTTRAAYPQIEAAIRQLHSYDEPEILALPVVAGSGGYLQWVAEEVRGG